MAEIFGCALTAESALQLGRKVAAFCGEGATVVIGKDTRAEGDMLSAALAAGICSGGVGVLMAGTVAAPAVSYLVQRYGCNMGLMVTDRVKLFGADGAALPAEGEALLADKQPADAAAIGRIDEAEDASADYLEYIMDTVSGDLRGRRVGLDCAQGATSDTAKVLFKMLGAEVHCINDGSGTEGDIATLITENGLDIGFKFSADGSGCTAYDAAGNQMTSEQLLMINSGAESDGEGEPVFADYLPVPDGQLTALQTLAALIKE